MVDSWPYQEAEKVLKLIQQKGKSLAVFECGFGPSGLPHIGTVAEMLRTKLVIDAFADITSNLTPSGGGPESYYQVDWILFADDLDALRKVPRNVIDQDEMEKYIGVAVCDIPDPYGRHDSYAGHNIAELVNSLEFFGLTMKDYKLVRASQMYRRVNNQVPGIFNNAIMNFAKKAYEIKDIITHDYSKERISSYCPFLPIMEDGRTQIEVYDWSFQDLDLSDAGVKPAILYYRETPDGERIARGLFNGDCKLQWKADWPLRWYAFDVDYEMHGKDLLGSAQVGDKIMRLMGRRPPIHMMYELFLDETGKKISKSDGTNDALHDWCHYTIPEVMEHFLTQNPRKARKLHFGLIPQMTDGFLKEQKASPITFSMLLNLVSITNTEEPKVLWSFIQNYIPDAMPQQYPILEKLVGRAINYYETIVLPTKKHREPTDSERSVLKVLRDDLDSVVFKLDENSDLKDDKKAVKEILTTIVYDVGKQFYGEEKDSLRNFFKMVYEVIMGQESGPRLPIFIMLYGIDNTIKLLEERLIE